MEKVLVGMVLIAIIISFLGGAKVGKETTQSPMYHRDYKECISKLPRNQDCVADKIVFKVVDNGK